MTRRTWCILAASLAAPPLAAADPAVEAWDVISAAARALAGGNASEFIGYFDRGMPGHATLRSYATALVGEAELQSSIDPVSNEGDERARTVVLDWLLRIAPRGTAAAQTERRRNVTCRLEKRGRNWRIVLFEPLAFLAPSGAG